MPQRCVAHVCKNTGDKDIISNNDRETSVANDLRTTSFHCTPINHKNDDNVNDITTPQLTTT